MSMFKKISAVTLAGLMCAGALAGCGGSDNGSGSKGGGDAIKIGFVNEANTDVFDMKRMEALQDAVDASGGKYSLECTDANLDIQKQIDQSKTFIAKGVDVLMVVPCDSEGIVPAINEANSAGVPTVCFGIKAASGDFTYVGSESYDAGYMQGELMAKELPENATVMYLLGTQGLIHTVERERGFEAAMKDAGRDDVKIAEKLEAKYVKDEAMRITQTWIQSYSDGKGGVKFDAVVAQNDQMALGAVEALKTAGILTNKNEIIITGIDGTPEAVQAVIDGQMTQTVLQDAKGQATAGLKVVDKLAAGEKAEDEVVPFQNIVADNAKDFVE